MKPEKKIGGAGIEHEALCVPSKSCCQTYLNPRLERQVGVSGVGHLEDASESIFCQVADFQDFEVGRHGAEIELADEDVIDDDWGFGRLVQRLCEQVPGARVELCVRRQRRPVEVERHVEMAVMISGPWDAGWS